MAQPTFASENQNPLGPLGAKVIYNARVVFATQPRGTDMVELRNAPVSAVRSSTITRMPSQRFYEQGYQLAADSDVYGSERLPRPPSPNFVDGQMVDTDTAPLGTRVQALDSAVYVKVSAHGWRCTTQGNCARPLRGHLPAVSSTPAPKPYAQGSDAADWRPQQGDVVLSEGVSYRLLDAVPKSNRWRATRRGKPRDTAIYELAEETLSLAPAPAIRTGDKVLSAGTVYRVLSVDPRSHLLGLAPSTLHAPRVEPVAACDVELVDERTPLGPVAQQPAEQPAEQAATPVAEPVGRKFDKDKPALWAMLRLFPLGALTEVGEVLMEGAKRYGPYNWVNVDPERYRNALARHMFAYMHGQQVDPDTGRLHIAAVAANAIFLTAFELFTPEELAAEQAKHK